MNTPAAILNQVVTGRGPICADTVAMLTDTEKMELLRVVGETQRRLDALLVETVATVPARAAGSGDAAFCGQFGCRSMNELLQRVLRVDAAGAGRVVKAAEMVRREPNLSSGTMQPARWPQLRAALSDGTIGITGLLAATAPLDQAARRITAEDRSRGIRNSRPMRAG